MAKRRAIAQGIGSALQEFAKLQYQAQLQRDNAEYARQAQFGQQRQQSQLTNLANLIPEIQAGTTRPGAITPEGRALLGGGIDLEALVPSDPQRYKPITEKFSAATDISGVPSDIETRGLAAALGGEVDKIPGMVFRPSQAGEIPSSVNGMNERPSIQSLMAQRQAAIDRITNANALNMDEKFATAEGTAFSTAKGTDRAANEFLPNLLNRNKEIGNVETGIQANRLRTLGPLEATNAANRAGAVRRAELAPDIVASEVAKAQQIAEVQAGAQAMGNPTDTQRRAAGQLPILLNSYQNLQKIQAANPGIGWSPGLMTAISSPTAMAVADALRYFSPEQKAFAQASMNAAGIVNFILSGQQTRADELPRAATNYFPVQNDPPDLIAQKDRTFKGLLSAIQMQAGRGQYGVGQVMGQMLKSGQLDQTIIKKLMDDGFIAQDVIQGMNDFAVGGVQ